MARAVELCQESMATEISEQTRLRDILLAEVPKKISGVTVNGSTTHRLPNNAHFSFDGIQSEALLMSLDMNGICASMGSACTSGHMEPSHVLKAIRLPDHLANSALRITIGRWTTEAHILRLLDVLPQTVDSLRI